jgi:hypothetical protein
MPTAPLTLIGRIQLFPATESKLKAERGFCTTTSGYQPLRVLSPPEKRFFKMKEITMTRLFRGTTRIFVAVFAMLLVGGAVAFAQHNATLARIFSAPAKAVAVEGRSVVREPATPRPLVTLSLTGAIERDSKQVPVEKAGPVTPGEVVNFTMNSVNEGSASALQYRAVGQIPRSSTFVEGSALGAGTRVSYSIDNGNQFSATPMIDEKQADGTIKKVAAPVSMYTQLRFEWSDPLVAGGKNVASYQVRVN